MKEVGDNSEWPGPAAARARRVAEDNEEMLKRWGPAAAELLRDADGNCWGGQKMRVELETGR